MTTEFTGDENELATQGQLSAETGKSEPWFERQRWAGTGPKFVKVGRSVLYRRGDWNEYLAAQLHVSTRAKAVRHGEVKS